MTAATQILIVDDDPASLKILQRALQGLGEVHCATSGAQALQIVADHPIDLVLLDILMPAMDGFATCRALVQAHPNLAVIFVTASSDTADEVKALAVGGRDFVSKPINPAVVRARVTLHLKLRRIEGQLRDSEGRYRELNAALEQRVAERTAEILAANASRREREERLQFILEESRLGS